MVMKVDYFSSKVFPFSYAKNKFPYAITQLYIHFLNLRSKLKVLKSTIYLSLTMTLNVVGILIL